MSIHPTATIDPRAELPGDIVIGPGVCIEGALRTGARCVIQAHAVVCGEVVMGDDNLIGYGAVIGAAPQDLAFRSETRSRVEIGSRNVIREHATIHRGTAEGSETRVGDDNFLMAGAHLGHNVQLGNRCIVANNALLGGYVKVEDRVFIGGASIFHQHVRVGQMALTQGGCGISKDVPPFCIAAGDNTVAGLNVIGLRRGGISPEERQEIKEAFRLIYRSGLNVTQALARARLKEWRPAAKAFFEFVSQSGKRGLCALRSSRHTETES